MLAERHPDRTAILHAALDGSERVVTWDELERRSNQVARLFADRGVAADTMVVVALPNIPEHFFCAYAAWKLGATVLPMRWDLPAWERDRLLAITATAAVVGDWTDAPGTTISTTELRGSEALDDSPLPDKVPRHARAIATSGSTGSPKLILTPTPGIVDMEMAAASRQFGMREQATQLVISPLYHTNGFACHLGLLDDQTLVLMERFDPERAVDLIERHDVNHVVMVPTMLQRIARVPGVGERDFSSVDSVLYGGAPIAPWVVRTWLDLVGPEHFVCSYGGTEAVGLVVGRGDEWLTHEGTVGRPSNCDLRIQDSEGHEVAVGEIGEIYMRQHNRDPTFEYVGAPMPEPTVDGYRTLGDLGWVDGDGYLYIADRRVDMIVTGGANVYPAEVEAALSELTEIADVVVIGLPDPEWGRRVHAIVEAADPGHPPSVDALRAHCADRLASYKVPKSFEIVERVPRTAAGKINRSALIRERSP
jgi:bile acid-coenzyme A ligase